MRLINALSSRAGARRPPSPLPMPPLTRVPPADLAGGRAARRAAARPCRRVDPGAARRAARVPTGSPRPEAAEVEEEEPAATAAVAVVAEVVVDDLAVLVGAVGDLLVLLLATRRRSRP